MRCHGLGPSLVVAAGKRRPSTFALVGRTGKQKCAEAKGRRCVGATSGGRVHMYGARIRPVLPPHRAARQERARQPRPRRRLLHPPARPAAERLADRDLRSRRAVLVGTGRRGPDHEPMPAGRDRPTGQARPRRGHRARRTGRRRWRSGSDHRRDARHPAFLPGGEAARPWDAATGALVRRPRRRRSCAPPLPRSPPRPSLAACRCRCRRPRTVCVVPRERGGGTGGVSRERTRPGTGDPMSASGPPSVRW